MIIGNGMMATRFQDYAYINEVIIFASGVANSLEQDPAAFQREASLLMETIQRWPEKLIVYFGTCSIFDPSQQDSPYIQHKKRMEDLLIDNASRYLICRTTNIVGPNGNRNTIINYLIDKISNQERFELWTHSVRNILDVDDLHFIVSAVLRSLQLERQLIINVCNPHFYSIDFLVNKIEEHLSMTAILDPVMKGSAYSIPDSFDTDFNALVASRNFDGQYFSRLLRKYYPARVVQHKAELVS